MDGAYLKKKKRQEDLKLWASLAYLVELCQKQTKQQKQFYDKYTGFLIHGSSALVSIIMKRNYYKLKIHLIIPNLVSIKA